jgi:hypothetical protein
MWKTELLPEATNWYPSVEASAVLLYVAAQNDFLVFYEQALVVAIEAA